MSAGYKPILWNQQKKHYDWVMLFLMVLYLVVFTVTNKLFYPGIQDEALIIRGTGTLAIIMLHVILIIGPLTRLNKKFMPLLYNRRHLGVAMFLIAAVHGIFCIIQFHALGNVNPIVSLFTSNLHYDSLVNFPFQVLGFFSLIILFLMAVTSHDFWLHNLSPRVWKSLHMLVYMAYAMLVMHVMLGVIQYKTSPVFSNILGVGIIIVVGLHLAAGFRTRRLTKEINSAKVDGFVEVCSVDDIAENRAKMASVDGCDIAIFKYDNQLSAVDNACKHQNGPLSEGKIIDGCITCPWHGYQYQSADGCSPPPFEEKVSTYQLKLIDRIIWVNPEPKPEGTFIEPLKMEA